MRLFSTLVAFLVLVLSSAAFAQKGDEPTIPSVPIVPIFESHGNVSGGLGSGWWNLQQYEDRASISVGSTSLNRIVSTQSGLWVDRYDPSRFSFHASVNFEDNTIPSGMLNFSQSSSDDVSYSHLSANDRLQNIWGEDENGEWTVIGSEWWSNFHLDLNTPSIVNGLNGSLGRWSNEWANENGEVYFSRSGDSFFFSGYGTFLGSDPVGTGKDLVKSGFASYSVQVPEPASLGLIAFSAIGLLIRRRR